ncbi:hypothetical protein HK102_005272, partial [Quaeritorhiza haematococci]
MEAANSSSTGSPGPEPVFSCPPTQPPYFFPKDPSAVSQVSDVNPTAGDVITTQQQVAEPTEIAVVVGPSMAQSSSETVDLAVNGHLNPPATPAAPSTITNGSVTPVSIPIPVNASPVSSPPAPIPYGRTTSRSSLANVLNPRKRADSTTKFQEGLPRNYNTGAELENVVTALGIRKKNSPWDKIVFLGFLSGTWVVFAGLFTIAVAGGVPADVRAAWPAIPKLLVACTFPVGIIFILLFGGELFTGNTMIMVVALLNRKVTLWQLCVNWFLVFWANLFTVVLWTYLLGYLTHNFDAEPFHSFIVGIANTKAQLPFYVALLRAIPANALVCLAFFLGLAARDVTGKIIGLYLPVAVFAATGWEHCVANMFFLSLGWFHGANVTLATFCANIFTVTLGNIIGGSLLIGGSEYYMYHWHAEKEPTKHWGLSKRATPTGGLSASAAALAGAGATPSAAATGASPYQVVTGSVGRRSTQPGGGRIVGEAVSVGTGVPMANLSKKGSVGGEAVRVSADVVQQEGGAPETIVQIGE